MSGLTFALLTLALFAVSEQGEVKIPSGNYNVEVYFVVDEKSLTPYLAEENNNKNKAIDSMRSDVNYFLTEVNKLYTSLYQTKLKISVRHLDFITGHAYQSGNVRNDKFINKDSAINDFDSWLATEDSQARYNYDLAILFTGYNLDDEQSDKTAGYAHAGTVCRSNNSGIVEFDATYLTVVTTAHEIAHILGANHDGQQSSYVMAPIADMKGKDRWWFSLCTASNAWDVINSLKENCMLSTSPQSTVPNAGVTDNLSNPEKICQRAFGSKYYFANIADGGRAPAAGDAVCKQLVCGLRGTNKPKAAYSSDGLPCAKGKTCQEGKCQSDPGSAAAAAVKDDKCVFGDPTVMWYNEDTTCKAMMTKYYQVCTNEQFRTICCESCAQSSSKKRGLVSILLDRSLDNSEMLNALEMLRDQLEGEADERHAIPNIPLLEPIIVDQPIDEELPKTIA